AEFGVVHPEAGFGQHVRVGKAEQLVALVAGLDPVQLPVDERPRPDEVARFVGPSAGRREQDPAQADQRHQPHGQRPRRAGVQAGGGHGASVPGPLRALGVRSTAVPAASPRTGRAPEGTARRHGRARLAAAGVAPGTWIVAVALLALGLLLESSEADAPTWARALFFGVLPAIV